MSEDMVERVASRMAAQEGWRWDDDKQMLECAAVGLQNTSRERATWRNRALTAIQEMREPTVEMQSAIPPQTYTIEHYHGSGHHQSFPTLGSGPMSIWRAMIDAALSNSKQKETER